MIGVIGTSLQPDQILFWIQENRLWAGIVLGWVTSREVSCCIPLSRRVWERDVPLVVCPLRWFFCLLGCESFHFVPCIPPFLGALGPSVQWDLLPQKCPMGHTLGPSVQWDILPKMGPTFLGALGPSAFGCLMMAKYADAKWITCRLMTPSSSRMAK
jgi:hypothetical protein